MPAQNLSDDMRPREIAVSVADATDTLTAAGIADARVDAELLLAHMLGVGRGELQAAALRGDTLDEASDTRFRDLVARRASREPLQHITGTAPFRHLELRVGPGVFVPRPETETLIEIALAEPLTGVARGQAAVLYAPDAQHGDLVLGSGRIRATDSDPASGARHQGRLARQVERFTQI